MRTITKLTLAGLIALSAIGCKEVIKTGQVGKNHVRYTHTELPWGGIYGQSLEVSMPHNMRATFYVGGYDEDLDTNISEVCVSDGEEEKCKDIGDFTEREISEIDSEYRKHSRVSRQ